MCAPLSASDKPDRSPWVSYRAPQHSVDGCDLHFDELREEFLVEESLEEWLRRTGDLAALPRHPGAHDRAGVPEPVRALPRPHRRVARRRAHGGGDPLPPGGPARRHRRRRDHSRGVRGRMPYVALGQGLATERWSTDE